MTGHANARRQTGGAAISLHENRLTVETTATTTTGQVTPLPTLADGRTRLVDLIRQRPEPKVEPDYWTARDEDRLQRRLRLQEVQGIRPISARSRPRSVCPRGRSCTGAPAPGIRACGSGAESRRGALLARGAGHDGRRQRPAARPDRGRGEGGGVPPSRTDRAGERSLPVRHAGLALAANGLPNRPRCCWRSNARPASARTPCTTAGSMYSVAGVKKPTNGEPYVLTNEKDWQWLGEVSNAARWLKIVPLRRSSMSATEAADPTQAERCDTLDRSRIALDLPAADELHPQVWVPSYPVYQPFRLALYGEKSSSGADPW